MARYRCNLGHQWDGPSAGGAVSCRRCGAPAKETVPEQGTLAIEPMTVPVPMPDGTVDIPPAPKTDMPASKHQGTVEIVPIAKAKGADPASDATVDIVPADVARVLNEGSGQTVDLVAGTPVDPASGGRTIDIEAPAQTGILGGADATQQRLRPDATIGFSDGAPADASDKTGAWGAGDGTQKMAAPHAATGRWGKTEAGDAANRPREKQGPAAVGTRIAGYDILGELGRGGMGVVYKARQAGLNRLVALKMIISGAHAGATELARFKAEAESIAGLAHPNIVQVYEVGDHEGLPFFSLEFVDGKGLDRLIDGAPQEPKQAARWCQQLANGLFAAHKAGIIHRDMKPANVLLTRDGVPKITDFGLAKRFEDGDSGNTRTGSILGTPSYMPPEQAAGKTKETGPPADIYSLGAIFYELLTGRPPFRGASPLETIKQVQKMEPVPPTRLQPSTPRDLETICLKCLEKEPAKRYATAGALAEDVRRYLNNEPILARPTPALERGVKWAKRNPQLAGLYGAIVAGVLAVLGVGLWYNVYLQRARVYAEQQKHLAEDNELEARRQEGIAKVNEVRAVEQEQAERKARAEAEAQRGRAEANFRHAQDAVEQMLTRVGNEKLANVPRMEKVRKDLLRRALVFYLKFMESAADNAALRYDAGRAQIRVGDIHEKLGEPEKAEEAYRAAIQLFGELTKVDPNRPEYRSSLAAAYNDLGILLQSTKRYADADKAIGDALKIKEELLAGSVQSAEFQADLAKSLVNQANLLAERSQLPASIAAFQKAVAILTPLVAKSPTPELRRDAARARGSLGVLLINDGKVPNGEKALRESEQEMVALVAAAPEATDDRLELARTRFNLGTLMQITNRPADADKLYRDAAAILQKLTDEYPDVIEYRQLLVDCDKNRGVLLRATNKAKDAEPIWREAVTLLSRLTLELPKDASYRQRKAEAQNELAIALVAGAKNAEAETNWREAIAESERLVASNPSDAASWRTLLESRTNLCALLAALGRGPDELKARQELLAALDKRLAASPKDADTLSAIGQAQNDLAVTHFEANRPADAAKCLREAIRRQREAIAAAPMQPAYSARLAAHFNGLYEVLLRQGDHAALTAAVNEFAKEVPAGPAFAPAAAALVKAMSLAEKDQKLPADKRKEQAEAHAAQAIALLRQAALKGYKDTDHLRKAPEFEPLRAREDFKKLLADMIAAGKAASR